MALNNTVTVRMDYPDPSFIAGIDPKQLPSCAGNNWRDSAFAKTHFKSQSLSREYAGKEKPIPINRRPREEMPQVATKSAYDLQRSLASAMSKTPSEEVERLTLDDKLLRFYAFFEEPVNESPIEKVRIRKVTISFFPADETLSISEPRIQNSGLPGGLLLKRGRVPTTVRQREELPNEDYLNINHLNLGKWIKIYGRFYYFYDCDNTTREFMEDLGMQVAPSEQAPDDDFTKEYKSRRARFETTGLFGIRSGDYHAEEANRGRRFVEDGGKVLRFSAQWDDREAVGGIVHDLEVRYFVEDDTMSVKENQAINEVCSAQFLSRRRLPKDGNISKAAELTFAGRVNGQRDAFLGKPNAYYNAEDLYVGMTLNVLGRSIILTDCDDYTREYYSQVFGIEQGEPIEGYGTPKALNNTTLGLRRAKGDYFIPPPTGFGEDEDSKASCKSLVLKPPKKRPALAEDGEILRYELKFHNPERPEDRMRRFILNYYVDDGEVMIQEVAARNTGFTGGCFLKKQLLRMNPDQWQDPPIYLKFEDIGVGKVLNVNHFQFMITTEDLHTKNYLNAKAHRAERVAEGIAPEAEPVDPDRLIQVLKHLHNYVTVRYLNLTDAFRAFDEDKDNKITIQEMRKSLKANNITHRENESLAVLKQLDKSKNGYVSYTDWMSCFGIKHQLNVDATDPNSPWRARANAGDGSGDSAEELDRYQANAQSKQEDILRSNVLRRLKEKLEARHLNCFEMFRMICTMPRAYKGRRSDIMTITNVEKDSTITPVQLKRCVQEILGLMYTEREMEVLLEFFFPELERNEYNRQRDITKWPCVLLEDFQRRFVEMVRIGTLEPNQLPPLRNNSQK